MKKLTVLFAAGALTAAGCAMLQKPAPKFDPAQSAASQAATFVNVTDGKRAGEINKVAVTSCNVMIGQVTGASSATHGGLGDNSGRVDKKVSSYFYLHGISDEQQQALAEDLCRQAEAQFKTAGFEVVTMADLAGNEHYQKMQAGGKPSPYEHNPGGPTKYKLFAPKGQTITNPQYVGAGKQLSMAFAAAAGNNPAQHETRLMEDLKADAAHVNIYVDFAQVESDQQSGFLSGLTSQNSASVKGQVAMTVRGNVQFLTNESLGCNGKTGDRHECWVRYQGPRFGLKQAMVDQGDFKATVANETTKADGVSNAFSSAVGFLAAAAGGNGLSGSVKRTGVTVEPQNFSATAKKLYGYVIDMETTAMKNPG